MQRGERAASASAGPPRAANDSAYRSIVAMSITKRYFTSLFNMRS